MTQQLYNVDHDAKKGDITQFMMIILMISQMDACLAEHVCCMCSFEVNIIIQHNVTFWLSVSLLTVDCIVFLLCAKSLVLMSQHDI